MCIRDRPKESTNSVFTDIKNAQLWSVFKKGDVNTLPTGACPEINAKQAQGNMMEMENEGGPMMSKLKRRC